MKTTLFLMFSVIASLLITSCTSDVPVFSNEQAICVKTETLSETRATVPISTSGILSSKQINKLSFKTGGIISKIYVENGNFVKKGQLLAILDITEILAQVQQARVAFDKAERDLTRVKNLYADTVVTLSQLQDATSAYEAALENKNIAEFNLRYSQITAPSNGRIVAKLAEENEMIGPGMPLLVFAGNGKDEWVIKTGVSDKDAVRIEKGDSAQVAFDAFPNQLFCAIVTSISGIADAMSGTFEVELKITKNQDNFINGLVAKVSIQSKNSQIVTLVPPNALTDANGNNGYVYIVQSEDTTAHKVAVTIAYIQNEKIAVLEPLNEMGQVITTGSSYLEDGLKVNIVQ